MSTTPETLPREIREISPDYYEYRSVCFTGNGPTAATEYKVISPDNDHMNPDAAPGAYFRTLVGVMNFIDDHGWWVDPNRVRVGGRRETVERQGRRLAALLDPHKPGAHVVERYDPVPGRLAQLEDEGARQGRADMIAAVAALATIQLRELYSTLSSGLVSRTVRAELVERGAWSTPYFAHELTRDEAAQIGHRPAGPKGGL